MGMILSVYEDNGKTVENYNLDDFNKDAIGFGRENDCDIIMNSSYVSRLHGCIYKENGCWYIKDLDSSYGLYYNSKKINDMQINGGEHIKIGNKDGNYSELVFRVKSNNVGFDNNQFYYQAQPINPQPYYPYNGQMYNGQPYSYLGMKWYNFIIWFQLFAVALYCLYAAFIGYSMVQATSESNIRNSYYDTFDEYGNDLYRLGRDTGLNDYFMKESGLEDLKIIGIITIIVALSLAVCAIYVRVNLAKFKKGAPRDYLLFSGLISIALIGVQVLLAYDEKTNGNGMVFFVIICLAISAIYIYANYDYFRKRSYLFVN